MSKPTKLFKIKRRWNGQVLFQLQTTSLKLAVEAAVSRGISLDGASLDEASLDEASLRGVSLRRASLRGVSLENASLDWASLRGASLDGASLRGASLDGASLDGASLESASLDGVSLRGVSLRRASLDGASLRGADLTPIRDDLWAVLSSSPAEVAGLHRALLEGRVDGSTYEGDCACLVGTLANVRRCPISALPLLQRNAGRPAERFFLGIVKGDTPQTNPVAQLAADWIAQWLTNMRAAFGTTTKETTP